MAFMQKDEASYLQAPLTATCLCEAVQLNLPPPTTAPVANYLCHCLLCRHELGSLFAWQIRYQSSALKISRGQESITYWSAKTDLPHPETGEKPHLAFCKICGTSLFGASHGTVVVRGGALDLEGGEKDKVREWIEGERGRENGWWPSLEFFTKRRPVWFKQMVEGAQQRNELSN